jgi:hypothetical protein
VDDFEETYSNTLSFSFLVTEEEEDVLFTLEQIVLNLSVMNQQFIDDDEE